MQQNSREGLLDALCEVSQAQRACQWEQGRLINGLLAQCVDAKTRRAETGAAATALHCTASHIRSLALVERTFPPAQRYPDVDWSLYRACMQAATRAGAQSATHILELALARGWHCADVHALGKPAKDTVPPCPTCGRA